MLFIIFVSLCVLLPTNCWTTSENAASNIKEDSRKLFGGYRITPRFCKPTRKEALPSKGPSICMFNHECIQRNGYVVGACMDGFLFGACCQLPSDIIPDSIQHTFATVNLENNLYQDKSSTPQTATSMDITSSGVSQIAESLLNPSILPTAQDNIVIQIGGNEPYFSTTGVTHSPPDNLLIGPDNIINPNDFKPTTKSPNQYDQSTIKLKEGSNVPYPVVHISVSNAPSYYTPSPGYEKPIFRPKPYKPSNSDKYVLVPTINHDGKPPNKTMEVDAIVNILHMLNDTSYYTSKKPPSTSYIYSSSTTSKPITTTSTKKPPSTSYVYSTTLKPRRTTQTTITTTTTTKRKPSNNNKKTTTKPNRRKTTPAINRPGHSTFTSSPTSFLTTPSTSYVSGPTPTRRPPATVTSHIIGPSFSVTSNPGQYSSYPSPAPTLIVLGGSESEATIPSVSPITPTYQTRPSYPGVTQIPQRKPINSVTINNHVIQNIYSTSERPQPTVLITPKPISTSTTEISSTDDTIEIGTSADDLMNFPPVRNPNLNMSNPLLTDEDITTPTFVEDEALNQKLESFVNKIVLELQEPFHGLRDVVYNNNKTSSSSLTTSGTTKRPSKKPGNTTKKPPSRRPSTTKKPSSLTTKRPTTTRKTKRPITTTTESLLEIDNTTTEEEQYRNQCGIRPLLRNGRIVGGKGAVFGAFPWQVLVRESTWLGLFTKNKCGGVLISNRYVMTAAHCQPGFLASLVAVFGEFDISGELESKRSVSRNVKRVIVHRQYDAATFENDLALLELETPVQFDSHIIPICMPYDDEDFTGRMATVTGWGRLKYGGGVPSVLQEVQVPIMENHVCQEMFRTAGHSKVILESFLCAGYANGQKDSCEGDSGGPLVLQRSDGRYQLAGTVSHGIKCAAPYLPGVYMRTTYYKPWIESITGIQTD